MKDFPQFQKELDDVDRAWVSPRLAGMLDELKDADAATYDWDTFLKEHEDGSWHLEFAYLRGQEIWAEFNGEELERQWHMVLARLGQRHLEKKARAMEIEIRAAEGEQDQTRLKVLLTDFSRLRQDIARLFRL